MHEVFYGQRQRKARVAVEGSLRALGAGSAAEARAAAAQAVNLDQIGIYSGFDAAVAPLADRLDGGAAIDDAGWDSLSTIPGLVPLSGLIDELRS